MKIHHWGLALLLICMTSCSQKFYYLAYVTEPTPIYASANDEQPIYVVPPYHHLLTEGKSQKRKASYGTLNGYVKGFKPYRQETYTSTTVKDLYFNYDSSYTYKTILRRPVSDTSSTKATANWGPPGDGPAYNPYSPSSTAPSSGGPVHVKGYTRKDGTYVKPHTRSAPTKRK